MNIATLVTEALSQEHFSAGLAAILTSIAREAKADGVILWQQARELTPTGGWTEQDRITIVAQFPEDERSPRESIPLVSVTGTVLRSRQYEIVDSFQDDPRTYKQHPFLRDAIIRSMCSLSLQFEDGTLGALNLYRTNARFETVELPDFAIIAALIPVLVSNLMDRITQRLMNAVNGHLSVEFPADTVPRDEKHPAEALRLEIELLRRRVARAIASVCENVSEAFGCREVSVFMRRSRAATFTEIASTWSRPHNKTEYVADANDGITGWVLYAHRPIHIADLPSVTTDPRYPGMVWQDSLEIVKALREELGRSGDSELPPIAFIATPIFADDKVAGVIRCCSMRASPFAFTERELNVLTTVATHIARCWARASTEESILEENAAWASIVESVGKLNERVQRELDRPSPAEAPLYKRVLETIKGVIPGADITDVRLLDVDGGFLYFAEHFGDAWFAGTAEEQQVRRERRFPVHERPPRSAGARVFQTRVPVLLADPANEEAYAGTFAQTRKMIVAPILAGQRFIGVIDVRSTDDTGFPPWAVDVLALIGKQLGLYHELARTMRDRQRVQKSLTDSIAAQRRQQARQMQVFQDLQHQFRSPTLVAYKRIERLLHDLPPDTQMASRIRSLRGLVARAYRISYATKLFTDLANERPLRVAIEDVTVDALIRRIHEAAADIRLAYEASSRVVIRIDERAFRVIREIKVDKDLFDQAVLNILDNAGKYSFERGTVVVTAGFTKTRRFYIAVRNQGIPIYPDEVTKCLEREWQSEAAVSVSGYSTGIGLWIVDHVMRAHNGSVIILPTTKNDITEVRLVFPADSVGRGGAHEVRIG